MSEYFLKTFEVIYKTISILFVIVIVIFIFGLLVSNDKKMRSSFEYYQEKWIDPNHQDIEYLFTNIFPFAEKCNFEESKITESLDISCADQVRSQIDEHLDTALSGIHDPKIRMPFYFIRYKDVNHIEKLFQSGDYKIIRLSNLQERMAMNILVGNFKPDAFPQYTCYSSDDLPLCSFPINLILPSRHYFNDFYSETELIIPIRNNSEEIIGAVVVLHSDGVGAS